MTIDLNNIKFDAQLATITPWGQSKTDGSRSDDCIWNMVKNHCKNADGSALTDAQIAELSDEIAKMNGINDQTKIADGKEIKLFDDGIQADKGDASVKSAISTDGYDDAAEARKLAQRYNQIMSKYVGPGYLKQIDEPDSSSSSPEARKMAEEYNRIVSGWQGNNNANQTTSSRSGSIGCGISDFNDYASSTHSQPPSSPEEVKMAQRYDEIVSGWQGNNNANQTTSSRSGSIGCGISDFNDQGLRNAQLTTNTAITKSITPTQSSPQIASANDSAIKTAKAEAYRYRVLADRASNDANPNLTDYSRRNLEAKANEAEQKLRQLQGQQTTSNASSATQKSAPAAQTQTSKTVASNSNARGIPLNVLS